MQKNKRRCRHIATGVIYGSAKELADDLNETPNRVYKMLNGRTVDYIGIEYIEENLQGTVISEAKCRECLETKSSDCFGTDKRTGSIRGYTCKLCRSRREALRRVELGKDEMRIRSIKANYKVSRSRAEELFLTSKCDICQIDLTSFDGERKSTDRNIDHCHETGRVRGVLCCGCNLAIGHARENVDTLSNMIEYLKEEI